MIGDLFRAFGQLSDGRSRALLWRSILLAVASYAGLLVLAWIGIDALKLFDGNWSWLNRVLSVLGEAGAMVVAWLLFPGTVIAVMGFYVDRVVEHVEDRYYPALPPARDIAFSSQIAASLRLLAATVIVNILVLPVYLLLPGLNLVIYFAVNGYLIGREYFELVALRRLPAQEAKALRLGHGLTVWACGALVTALLFVPVLNLVAPLVGVALMTHRVNRIGGLGRPVAP